jgi:hypothetical protein
MEAKKPQVLAERETSKDSALQLEWQHLAYLHWSNQKGRLEWKYENGSTLTK